MSFAYEHSVNTFKQAFAAINKVKTQRALDSLRIDEMKKKALCPVVSRIILG